MKLSAIVMMWITSLFTHLLPAQHLDIPQNMNPATADSVLAWHKEFAASQQSALTKSAASIQSLESQILSQQQNIESQEQVIFFSTIVCIMFVLLSGLLYIQYDIKQQAFKRISEQNQLILEKNEEILRQKEKISYQKEQLRKLNQTKDKVFSVLSHDLRSPLLSIQSFLKLLEMNTLTEYERQEMLAKLKNATMATSETLEGVLQWATAQMKGFTKCNAQLFSLHEAISEVVAVCNAQAEAKNIFIHYEATEKLHAYADLPQIQIILRNLLSNAIKFTPKNGMIDITASQGNKMTEIRVQDRGLGMTEAQVAQLFNEQTHFSTLGTNQEKGGGLGLLLCKEFAEVNKGYLYVSSIPTKGTTFTLALPRLAPTINARSIASSQQ